MFLAQRNDFVQKIFFSQKMISQKLFTISEKEIFIKFVYYHFQSIRNLTYSIDFTQTKIKRLFRAFNLLKLHNNIVFQLTFKSNFQNIFNLFMDLPIL